MGFNDKITLRIWVIYHFVIFIASVLILLIQKGKPIAALSFNSNWLLAIGLILGSGVIGGYWQNRIVMLYSSLAYCIYVVIINTYNGLATTFNVELIINAVVFLLVGLYLFKIRKGFMMTKIK